MTTADVEDICRAVAAQILDIAPDQLARASGPASIANWDSLNFVRILLSLEAHFATSLAAEEIEHLTSFGSIVDVFAAHAARR